MVVNFSTKRYVAVKNKYNTYIYLCNFLLNNFIATEFGNKQYLVIFVQIVQYSARVNKIPISFV